MIICRSVWKWRLSVALGLDAVNATGKTQKASGIEVEHGHAIVFHRDDAPAGY